MKPICSLLTTQPISSISEFPLHFFYIYILLFTYALLSFIALLQLPSPLELSNFLERPAQCCIFNRQLLSVKLLKPQNFRVRRELDKNLPLHSHLKTFGESTFLSSQKYVNYKKTSTVHRVQDLTSFTDSSDASLNSLWL